MVYKLQIIHIMINLKTAAVIFVLLIATISSCVKTASTGQHSGSNATLTLSKSSVKRGEQVMVSTSETSPAVLIKWTTSVPDGSIISPANSQAAVIFALAGNYTITASYFSASDTASAYDSSSSPLTVTDSIYSPASSSTGDTTYLTGSIVLTPFFSDSGLIIAVQSLNLYDCTSYLTAYGWTEGGASLDFNFNWAEVVLNSMSCGGAQNPANAYMFFSPMADGYYPVTAELNQANYQGGLTVAGSTYTFSWNYNSGVTIAPKQVTRR
jgi:hypothetical protein